MFNLAPKHLFTIYYLKINFRIIACQSLDDADGKYKLEKLIIGTDKVRNKITIVCFLNSAADQSSRVNIT